VVYIVYLYMEYITHFCLLYCNYHNFIYMSLIAIFNILKFMLLCSGMVHIGDVLPHSTRLIQKVSTISL